jgi:hypothetical protein
MMSNVERFEELLRSDEALQEKMRSATEAYEGDKADECAVFEAVVVPLAAEVGLPFTFEEAKGFVAESEQLDLDDLDEVAGGVSFCIGVGGGDNPGADACEHTAAGANACGYVGVGVLLADC